MSKIELIHGDCLEEMKKIPDGSYFEIAAAHIAAAEQEANK